MPLIFGIVGIPKRGGGPLVKPAPGSLIDWRHPLAQGLKGCWLFQGGLWINSVDKTVASVNGTAPVQRGDYADFGAGSLNVGMWSVPKITIIIKFRINHTGGGWLVTKDDLGAGAGRSFALGTGDNEQLALYINTAGGFDYSYESTPAISIGAWAVFAMTYDGDRTVGYVNGKAATSTTWQLETASGAINSNATRIDICGRLTDYADIDISHVAIYNRALNPTEIAKLHSSPYQFFWEPGRILYFSRLYTTLDEVTPSDADYIQSETNPSNSSVELKLGPLTDPGVHTNHKLTIRLRKALANGSQSAKIQLVQGSGSFGISRVFGIVGLPSKGVLKKPAPDAQIDWQHPLAQGLVGCWLFNGGSGLNLADPASSIVWTGSPVERAINGRRALYLDGSTAGQSTGLKFVGATKWTISLSLAWSDASNKMIFEHGPNYSPNAFNLNYGEFGAGSLCSLTCLDSLNLKVTPTGFNTGNLRKICWTHDNNLAASSENTISVDNVAQSLTNGYGFNNESTTGIASGKPLNFFARNITQYRTIGYCEYFYFHTRTFSLTEIAQLHASPYQFFWEPTKRIFSSVKTIAEFTESNLSDTFTTKDLSLSETQASNITDYSDLRVKIIANPS